MVCPQETGWIQTPTNHWNRKASEGDDKGRVIQVFGKTAPFEKTNPQGCATGCTPNSKAWPARPPLPPVRQLAGLYFLLLGYLPD